jgi:rfaE bifunctional protein nucleotidyltransferase chain/domain
MKLPKKSAASPSLLTVEASYRKKFLPVEQIGVLTAKARAEGRTIVLAHGVFDLIHVGHLRHLQEAAKLGDILVVTITEDEHVNKGPGRPVFSEQLRAEMLAALEIVDYVGISRYPSAENIIDAIQPNIYIKGPDYENADEDLTGKIDVERHAVEQHGGRIVITHDVTFSSSALINRYLDVHDPALQEFLSVARAHNALEQVNSAISAIENMKVLLVGDTIIDDYHYVTPIGKSPKENIIATLHEDREAFAGGIIATANHLATFCKQVDVITSIGSANPHKELIRENLAPNIGLTLINREGAPTTRKRRFIDPTYMRKLFEVYYMEDSAPPPSFEKEVNLAIDEKISDYDVVIVNDFGHGMITPSTISILCKKSKFLAVNAQSNSGNIGFNLVTRYPRADYISIDLPEARLALANKYGDLEELAVALIPERVDCKLLAITHGKNGCLTYQPGKAPTKIPAFTKTVIDTMGAGDAFLAVTSPVAAAGAPLDIVGLIGNAAGAIKVGIIGHRKSIDKIALLKFLTSLLK